MSESRHSEIKEILESYAHDHASSALGQRAAEILASYDEDHQAELDRASWEVVYAMETSES